MMMMWFGRCYPASAYAECPQTETPVGLDCSYCGEKIAMGDDGWFYANGPASHRECYMRPIIGSVAHQQHRCSCFVAGASEDDEQGVSRREAARAALEYFESHQTGV